MSWPHAATDINSAINAANPSDTILVTNGIYQNGGTQVGSTSNRVYVSKTLAIQSVNGPAATIIKGYQVPGTTNGTSAVRCVYVSVSGLTLSGFTLTNGATSFDYGGGLYCTDSGGTVVVSNCVITGNSARLDGGGVYHGIFNSCVFSGNTSYGSLGGGAAIYAGLNNCLLVSNTAAVFGGGTYNGVINNCTFAGNYAGTSGGGAYASTLQNCILYYNNAGGSAATNGADACFVLLTNCCVGITNGPISGGIKLTNPPAFVDFAGGNFRLQTNSPCINAGSNYFITNITGIDLDGRPRLVGGSVDIGAYEFQGPCMGEFMGWLQQYGLPTSGAADYVDSNGDGFNNWQEWRAGTIPTNAASRLQMFSPALTNNSSGVTVSWQSVSGVNYFIQRGSDLSAPPSFSIVQSNIVGQAGSTSYTDTTATNGGPYFYRVGVQ